MWELRVDHAQQFLMSRVFAQASWIVTPWHYLQMDVLHPTSSVARIQQDKNMSETSQKCQKHMFVLCMYTYL